MILEGRGAGGVMAGVMASIMVSITASVIERERTCGGIVFYRRGKRRSGAP
jgi:hypothetical protein